MTADRPQLGLVDASAIEDSIGDVHHNDFTDDEVVATTSATDVHDVGDDALHRGGRLRNARWADALRRQLGQPGVLEFQSPADVYAEMASMCDKFSGISHDRIDAQGGLQWPCPTPEHPGTPTLHGDGPLRGKVAFQSTFYRPSDELPDEEYPLLLSTGRTLYHYNAATQTRRSSGAMARQPGNFIEMHRKDAKIRGLADGDPVRVSSRRGTVVAKVNISPRMRRGCVWMPLHFPESNTNRLTNDAGDPTTATAEYKVCAVTIEPIDTAAK